MKVEWEPPTPKISKTELRKWQALTVIFLLLTVLFAGGLVVVQVEASAQKNFFGMYVLLESMPQVPSPFIYTPTSTEVYEWLINVDTTNLEEYNETFMCGDFAITLINHMRERGWRGLFVAMEFDNYTENPTGIQKCYGNWGHAIVAIECIDGIWFIEPQTDGMWYWCNETHTHLDVWDVVWHWTDYSKCASAQHQAINVTDNPEYPFNEWDWFIQHINRMAVEVA